MNNEKLLHKRWKFTEAKLNEYLKIYKKLSARTQDKIQDIFNQINYVYIDLNKPISNSLKKKFLRIVEEWKESNLLNGYFKYKVEEILKKSYISNDEVLEILIWGAYLYERQKLDEYENALFEEVGQNLYRQGLNEIKPKKKNKYSLTWDFIISLLAIPNVKGIKWNDYIEALALTNAQEIKKQVTISLQQGIQPDIESNIFTEIVKKQNNRYLSINNNKYGGSLDLQLREIANLSFLKAGRDTGGKEVRFISDLCDTVTDMCSNMNNLVFNIEDYNIFDRYMGERKSELKWTRIKVFGLVAGINLPPIIHHFHYCHSTLTYRLLKK